MEHGKAKVWEENVVIPTYGIGEPNKNPMFLEKRVYQGSSGKVYPHPVIDKIYDEKKDVTYRAVFLENDYLKIMVLPELGGRIQRATDKTNNYDFVYYNHVIKPALVGLAGPWISGGIEFNWPQHHRPSTYDPVSFHMQENEDGSATVMVGEVENMFRTKGNAYFTLYPDKAWLEIRAQLYNRTSVPQTFLWWANPAVPVNDNTQSVFPPDVHAVMDHGKRDVSRFPIATGTYYKMDYSAGVDISRYKNIPVPTSYMACHSDYDFVGGYDYGKEAGILHIADHHIAPGKKQWTWGCGEFGQAWDRNLTDEDGPYVELMTGCFTDNQPDFSWLAPYEEKTFTQYFMPYKGVGMVKNATLDAAVGLETEGGNAVVTVYTMGEEQVKIRLTRGEQILFEEDAQLDPGLHYRKEVKLPEDIREEELLVQVISEEGKELVSYRPKKEEVVKIPEPARAAPAPEDAASCEDLYLYGLHLEQYRHATYDPADYYREGLRRDGSDIRLNNAYGKLLFNRGLFAESEPYFRRAVEKQLRSNPNPYDGEPLYQLGLSLKFQGKMQEAYDAFYKATWNGAWQDAAFYQLACIDCAGGDFADALSHIERSLVRNYHNIKARNLKSCLLRKMGRTEEAKAWTFSTIAIDGLDANSRRELRMIAEKEGAADDAQPSWEEKRILSGNHNTCLEMAMDYMEAGDFEDARGVLTDFAVDFADKTKVYPLIYAALSYCAAQLGDKTEALSMAQRCEEACSDYCFPHRLEDIVILEHVRRILPEGSKAPYYLGNLWYDKKQYDRALECWEYSRERDDTFPTVHRNLALVYYNKKQEADKALASLEKAYTLNTGDSRVLMELDQLYKKVGRSPEERAALLEAHMEQTQDRDDLYVEYITLLNILGRHEEALERTLGRQFHPWEGGEGKIPKQYVTALLQLAKEHNARGEYARAEELLRQAAGSYPWNLGEGKLYGAQENHIYYYLGCTLEAQGRAEEAAECFAMASTGISEPVGAMYYNDQPPEMIYYQGLALLKLGRQKEAYGRFNKLIAYGEAHLFDEMKIDYFAVSLPDLLIFEEDLNRKNVSHCLFMKGLGHLGRKETQRAEECFEEIRTKDSGFYDANIRNIF